MAIYLGAAIAAAIVLAIAYEIREQMRQSALDETHLAEEAQLQEAYWSGLDAALKAHGGSFVADRDYAWEGSDYAIYRLGDKIEFEAILGARQTSVCAEMSFERSHRKSTPYFGLLSKRRGEIEQKLGYELTWEEPYAMRGNSPTPFWNNGEIRVCNPQSFVGGEADWPVQHAWLAETLNDLHSVAVSNLPYAREAQWKPRRASR